MFIGDTSVFPFKKMNAFACYLCSIVGGSGRLMLSGQFYFEPDAPLIIAVFREKRPEYEPP